jgi:histone acetyltransferase (RNA polymerase elongator complex component)
MLKISGTVDAESVVDTESSSLSICRAVEVVTAIEELKIAVMRIYDCARDIAARLIVMDCNFLVLRLLTECEMRGHREKAQHNYQRPNGMTQRPVPHS